MKKWVRQEPEKQGISVIIEKTATGYSAYVPELPGCISVGDNMDDIKNNIVEAIDFHLEGMIKEGLKIPAKVENGLNIEFKVDLQELFLHFKGILTKSAIARITGLNQSLISQYAIGLKQPSEKQAKKIEKALHELGTQLKTVSI